MGALTKELRCIEHNSRFCYTLHEKDVRIIKIRVEMSKIQIKKIIANILDMAQINTMFLERLNKRYQNDYIRVLNYHEINEKDFDNFEQQLKWYLEHFEIVDEKKLRAYMCGKKKFVKKPGILLTFDDGYKGNYAATKEVMNKYGINGFFFVSSELIEKKGYLSWEQLRLMICDGNTVGCHTATHHRMDKMDTDEILTREIIYSKQKIEKQLGIKVLHFCWCGGEEEHYTKKAADMIRKAGYEYGFMTNSHPLTREDDKFQIERTNIEAEWKMPLVRFQISGIMDKRFEKKRKRVEQITMQ